MIALALSQQLRAHQVVTDDADHGDRQAELGEPDGDVRPLSAQQLAAAVDVDTAARPGHVVHHQHQVPGNLAHDHDGRWRQPAR